MAHVTHKYLTLSSNGLLPDEIFKELVNANQISGYLSALVDITAPSPNHPQISMICDALLKEVEMQRANPEKLDDLEQSGVVELAVSVMLCHPKHGEIIAADFHTLRALVHNRKKTQARVGEIKGIQLIVRSMLFLRECENVQVAGAALLLDLTLCQLNRELMGQFFAIEVVMTALQSGGRRADLVGISCGFIANIAFQSEHNKQTIVKSGGVKLLLRSMKDYASDETIVSWAALALRSLAFCHAENKELIAKNRGLRYLLDAASEFKDSEKVQTHVMRAILNVVQDHKGNTHALIKLRGTDIIVQVMRKFRTKFDIQCSCCAILSELTHLADSSVHIALMSSGLEILLSAMLSFRSSIEIQEYGISIIHKCALHGPEARGQIVAAGGLETITSILNAQIGHEELVEKGVHLIRYIRSTRGGAPCASEIKATE